MAKVAIILWVVFSFAANCSNKTGLGDAAQVRGKEVKEGTVNPAQEQEKDPQDRSEPTAAAHPAAMDPDRYLPLLAGKRVGVVVNQTSTVADRHLVDALLEQEVDIRVIFAPEHGFRGEADAGAVVDNGLDVATKLPIQSLYGRNKKPSKEQLAGLDVLLFDIQDVGARFYTYISTLLYVMESAARYDKPVIVLDRPNPNGLLVDGPVLERAFTSFVGVAPVPVAHGLTVGEFARMANGEGWMGEGLKADLTVIPMEGYHHGQAYELPVPPSPNLPNQRSIYLYPHLCFFEGTALSVGRGTMKQFQLYGHPDLRYGDIRFTPSPGPGSGDPKLKGKLCRGEDLSRHPTGAFAGLERLNLSYLIRAHGDLKARGIEFFTRPDFFDLLAGTDQLRKDITAGLTEAAIREKWEPGLTDYKKLRRRYLLYP